MNIKKGDTVKILYGKDSGKTGTVLFVLTKKDKVLVSGINKVTKHIKGDGKTRKSEVVSIERPVPASKLTLICPNCSKPTRTMSKVSGSGFVRVCKKCKKDFVTVVKEVKKEEKTTKEKKQSKSTKKK